jgi:hypothetical protein
MVNIEAETCRCWRICKPPVANISCVWLYSYICDHNQDSKPWQWNSVRPHLPFVCSYYSSCILSWHLEIVCGSQIFGKIRAHLVLTGMYRGLSLNCYNDRFISRQPWRLRRPGGVPPQESFYLYQVAAWSRVPLPLAFQIPGTLRNAGVHYQVSPWVVDWVQNVFRLRCFFGSPRWYRVTGLPVFYICSLWSLETKLSLCKEYIVFKYAISLQI